MPIGKDVAGMIILVERDRDFVGVELAAPLAYRRRTIEHDLAFVAVDLEAAARGADRHVADFGRCGEIELNRVLQPHDRVVRAVADSDAAPRAAGEAEIDGSRRGSFAAIAIKREIAGLYLKRVRRGAGSCALR